MNSVPELESSRTLLLASSMVWHVLGLEAQVLGLGGQVLGCVSSGLDYKSAMNINHKLGQAERD